MDIDKELQEIGLTREQYEACMEDISDKINGINDMDWEEIKTKYNLPTTSDHLRKANSRPFGGAFAREYYSQRQLSENEVDIKLEQIRKEKIKLQTLNVERNRLDRAEARQELYYETISRVAEEIPLPKFKPLCTSGDGEMTYVTTIADVHLGAAYVSENNIYNPDVAKQRFEYLAGELQKFVKQQKISSLIILGLGDDIQGLLRISDLNVNDTAIVKSIVDVSRLLAQFLTAVSSFVNVEYYHTPSANHTQLRLLQAKASELIDEDVEYIIGNYIKDLCVNNERINIHLAEDGKQYVKIDLPDTVCYAMHGHQIKNIEHSIRDLSFIVGEQIDYLLLGHFHSGREIPSYESTTLDAEVLISPSFCGSDPYSDRIMKGSKAAVKIYGFDRIYGHTESYKIILN